MLHRATNYYKDAELLVQIYNVCTCVLHTSMIHSGWFLFADIHVNVWHCPWTVEAPWFQGQGLQDPFFGEEVTVFGCKFLAILFSFITWLISISIKLMSHLGTLRRSFGVSLALSTLLSPLVFSLTRTRLQLTWWYNMFQMLEAKRHMFFTTS
jgi:hypothetical protein